VPWRTFRTPFTTGSVNFSDRAVCVTATGYIDPGCETEHIVPGTQLELPLWLAQSLHSRNRRIASVELPKHYRGAQREILNADAAVVDLRRLSPYYYGIGTRLLAFDHLESSDVARSLLQVRYVNDVRLKP
jgi:GINS complex subunit 3